MSELQVIFVVSVNMPVILGLTIRAALKEKPKPQISKTLNFHDDSEDITNQENIQGYEMEPKPVSSRIIKVNPINKLKLAIYIGLVLVPMVTLITMICSSIIDYSRWPIYTETNIRKQNEANFPALTFCPAHVGYKADVLKVKLLQ